MDAIGDLTSPNHAELTLQISKLLNVFLSNKLPFQFRPIFFGASLIALRKKSGGIRPIAVGDTFRRLAAKCIIHMKSSEIAAHLQPLQVGCGVKDGIDAAVHSIRSIITDPTSCPLILKLDSIRRDHLSNCVEKFDPTLSAFYRSAINQNPGFFKATK